MSTFRGRYYLLKKIVYKYKFMWRHEFQKISLTKSTISRRYSFKKLKYIHLSKNHRIEGDMNYSGIALKILAQMAISKFRGPKSSFKHPRLKTHNCFTFRGRYEPCNCFVKRLIIEDNIEIQSKNSCLEGDISPTKFHLQKYVQKPL